ncbi:MAG: hypothetical protein ICV54_19525 [Nostoc sp. C3-bin3]|nr:hypothetical protein [Nostoc sp. C3-bin3]
MKIVSLKLVSYGVGNRSHFQAVKLFHWNQLEPESEYAAVRWIASGLLQ